jgi:hypothetical protein
MTTFLHSMTLEEVVVEWDKIDECGTNIGAVRALCLSDLYYLLIKVCKREDMLHPWVYARCREVEADPDGYLDLWSREHFKSSIITFGLTVQDILKNPEITVGFFSENYTLAQKFLGQIKKEFESNELLKSAFPDILYRNPQQESPNWNNNNITVMRKGNPKEPTVECQGLLSMKVGAHYALMVYDDVITMNSVSSPEMVTKINSFFELSLSQSKEGGKKRFIGTRYSYADTYQMMIEREIATVRLYAATDNGQPNGQPVLFSNDYWDQKKRENSTVNLSCQYLQNPNAGGQKVFDINQLNTYEIRPYKMNVAIVVDPAKSKKVGSANTAMLVIGISGGKRKYILDGYCHKMGLAERWDCLKHLYQKWKNEPGIGTITVGYETYGAGSVDVDYFQEQMKKEQSVRFPIKELQSALNGSSRKKDRIERIQPDLIHGNIFLPYPTDPDRLTKLQLAAIRDNCQYRISKVIKRKNELKQIYNLCDVLVMELDIYPYGKLVDLIDALSRIYDMEINAPTGDRTSFALQENELT